MFSIPWQCYHPSDTAIAEFLTVLHENPRKKIFVHCEYGSDRTGMSIAAHRMSDEGWSPEEARREMKAFGFNVLTASHAAASPVTRKTSPRNLKLARNSKT
jgi:hypothetical protein